jgi:hypothetical protein
MDTPHTRTGESEARPSGMVGARNAARRGPIQHRGVGPLPPAGAPGPTHRSGDSKAGVAAGPAAGAVCCHEAPATPSNPVSRGALPHRWPPRQLHQAEPPCSESVTRAKE